MKSGQHGNVWKALQIQSSRSPATPATDFTDGFSNGIERCPSDVDERTRLLLSAVRTGGQNERIIIITHADGRTVMAVRRLMTVY